MITINHVDASKELGSRVLFVDPESGEQIEGAIVDARFVGNQRWLDVCVDTVRWAVAVKPPYKTTSNHPGLPSPAPICQRRQPEAYAEIFG